MCRSDKIIDFLGYTAIVLAVTVVLCLPVLTCLAIRESRGPDVPVIRIDTPYGPCTLTGPAAEYVLHSAFPVVTGSTPTSGP